MHINHDENATQYPFTQQVVLVLDDKSGKIYKHGSTAKY